MSPSAPITLEDVQKVAPRVVERLRALADLPQHGTVAGQSVASLIWEEMGLECRGPVNDIDVFVNMNMPRTMRGLEEIKNSGYQNPDRQIQTASHTSGVSMVSSDYGQLKFIAARQSITIMRTYQVGLVNYTLINSPLISRGIGHGDDVSASLVDGFDLNVVGVGINLETGRVSANPGFIEFLNTRNIRVQTCNTPMHTLMRLAHKVFSDQIKGASCDYETERELLETAILCQAYLRGKKDISTVINFGGGKYKALYEQYKSVLPPLLEEKCDVSYQEEPYVFYSLDPADPASGYAQKIVQSAKLRAMPRPALQTVFVSKFPHVFDVLHPTRSFLDQPEVLKRKQAFEALNSPSSELDALALVQRVLGHDLVSCIPSGMDQEDATLFFFDQDCSKTLERVIEVSEIWEDLSPLEQKLVFYAELRADDVYTMRKGGPDRWKDNLEKMGLSLLKSVANLKSGYEADFSADLMKEMVATLKGLPRAGSLAVEQLFDQVSRASSTLSAIVNTYPAHEKRDASLDLIKWYAPTWPDVSLLEPEKSRTLAISMASIGFYPPEEFWQSMPSEQRGFAIEGACRFFREKRNSASLEDKLFRKAFLALGCAHLANDQLLMHDGMLARAVICLGETDVLIETLQSRPADVSALIARTAMENIEDVQRNIATFNISDDDFSIWDELVNKTEKLVDLEKFTIDISTIAAAAPQVRRSPRL